MSFQAYRDTIKARTGKTPDDLRQLAEARGLLSDGKVAKGMKAGDVVAWLKHDFDLGRGHAMAIWALFSNIKSMPVAQRQQTGGAVLHRWRAAAS